MLLGLLVAACLVPAGAQQSSVAGVAGVAGSSNVIVPPFVRFSGVLKDVNGNPLTGVVGVTFSLYKDSQSEVPVWSEVQNVYPDDAGRYSVMLGAEKSTGLPTDIFISGEGRWLSVQAEGQPEQARVLLLSVPYALKAADAETIGGLPASAFVLNRRASSGGRMNNVAPSSSSSSPVVPASSSDVTTTGGTVNTIPLFTTATNIQNSILTQNGSAAVNVAGKLIVEGNLGVVAGSSFQIGSKPFAFGSFVNRNAFLGFAGNSTMVGTANTASGYQALHSNTTGVDNTASGYEALYSNVTGELNTATGYEAMYSNTTGFNNTADGFDALYANTTGAANTASGESALYFNTTGEGNTANGFVALFYNTTGATNTASGASALFHNTTGSNNTAVGNGAGFNVTTGSNNIDIGNQGTSSDNGAIRIGTAGTQTSAFIAGIYGVKTSANNAVPVLIDSNGNLGTVSSSRRYKEDIQDMGDASSGLMRLRPVTFRYKKPFADGSRPMQYGLIAEEVAEVYPDMVARSADGQIETVKYQLLDPMLLNEVQRQQSEMQRQQTEIRELQERLSKMEAALATVSRTAKSR
jgi:hypothetical protein